MPGSWLRPTGCSEAVETRMRWIVQFSHKWVLILISLFSTPALAQNSYDEIDLTANQAGVARHTDPNLINPWGVTIRSSGQLMVTDNGTGVATLYSTQGGLRQPIVIIPEGSGGPAPRITTR